MPDRARVLDLIAHVEEGKYVEAIERFYTEDATMQENLASPRSGRDALAEGERRALQSSTIVTRKVNWFLVDGDRSVVNWVFEITGPDGKTRVMDEMACQDWRGDRICRERFCYDPASIAELNAVT
ncbi:MAG: nuclear transport factor 2 family protein [Parvibaculum sp.]